MIAIARVKQAVNEFVKVLRYGRNDIKTAEYVNPAGIESKPVKGDIAVHAETSSDSLTACLGYIRDSEKTKAGETVIYSTDSDGVRQLEFYMRNDGVAELGGDGDNLTSFEELKKGFDQLKQDFNQHTHASTVGTTGPPTPDSLSTSSIDKCKIDYLLVK